MGYDASAVTLVGQRLSRNELYKEITVVDICQKHLGTADGAKFCPECGKVLRFTEQAPVDGTEDLQLFSADSERDSDVWAYVFIKVSGDSRGHGGDKAKLTNIHELNLSDLERRACEALEPVGLWDPSRFGVWTILQESY